MTFNLIHGGQELFKKMRELTKAKPKILYHEEEKKYQIWTEPDYMLFENQGVAVVRAIKTKFDKKRMSLYLHLLSISSSTQKKTRRFLEGKRMRALQRVQRTFLGRRI